MLSRRRLLAATASIPAVTLAARARAQGQGQAPVIKIGALQDASGPYSYLGGTGSIACARQAIEEMAGPNNLKIELLTADHHNKPDIGTSIVREWLDNGVDALLEFNNSAIALAVNTLVRERDKVMLANNVGSALLSGKECSPNVTHWVFDTAELARVMGTVLTEQGGDSWYFIRADYVFGKNLQSTRPIDRFEPSLDSHVGDGEAGLHVGQCAQGSRRGGRIIALVPAEQSNAGLKHGLWAADADAVAAGGPVPLATHFCQTRTDLRGFSFEYDAHFVDLRRRDGWSATSQDAGLVPGDLGERLAKRGRVIVADRRDHRDERIENIRRVQPAADADLHDRDVHPAAGKVQERHRDRRLDVRRRAPRAISSRFDSRTNRLDHGHEVRPGNHLAAHPNALSVVHEMRLDGQADPQARRPEDPGDHRRGGSLPLGPGHEHTRELRVRIAERREEMAHPGQFHLVVRPSRLIRRDQAVHVPERIVVRHAPITRSVPGPLRAGAGPRPGCFPAASRSSSVRSRPASA